MVVIRFEETECLTRYEITLSNQLEVVYHKHLTNANLVRTCDGLLVLLPQKLRIV